MPDGSLRLFVACAVPEGWRASLSRETRRIAEAAPRARLVRPENLHLTLAFLGGTPAAAVPGIVEALRGASGRLPFRWRLASLGAFPDRRGPRVLWAGVDPGLGGAELSALAAAVRAALARAGSPVDADDFHAHVTLARLDPPRASGALEILLTRGALQDTYKPEVASDLRLMVSESTGHGVRYRTLAQVPFTPGDVAPSGSGPHAP